MKTDITMTELGITYTVTAYNVHIENSWNVRKRNFGVILDYIKQNEQHNTIVFQNRSMASLKREWACHNFLHSLGIAKERTKDVDLNCPQKWYVRLTYNVGGVLVWIFVK